MIVHLGLSNGITYFLYDKMDDPLRGLVDLEAYRVPQWCSFEKIITFDSSRFGIEKEDNSGEWVVCDWCNTPKGKLYAGVKWFDTFLEAYHHLQLDLFQNN